MRILTILFATLFLMGCPETDTAETTDATKQDAADVSQAVDADTTADTTVTPAVDVKEEEAVDSKDNAEAGTEQ
jgi:PBP1b-binding outer membrane lipoprotein LpoB